MFFQIRPSKHLSYLSHIKLKIKHPQIFKLYKWKKAQTELLASSLSGANQFCWSSERKSEIIDRIFCWHWFLSCDLLQGKMSGIGNFWYPQNASTYCPTQLHKSDVGVCICSWILICRSTWELLRLQHVWSSPFYKQGNWDSKQRWIVRYYQRLKKNSRVPDIFA